MRKRAWYAALGIALLITIESVAGAQDTTGVRLGLTYSAGAKPGVIVLPVHDDFDDSLRVIVQRDLDYSDRLNPIMLDNATASGLVPAGGKVDYPVVAKFGAALLVHMTPTATGLQVAAYDVAGKKLLQSEHFLFDRRDRDWRFALHGISDQIEAWVFGKRGIAQTRIAYIACRAQPFEHRRVLSRRRVRARRRHRHPRLARLPHRCSRPLPDRLDVTPWRLGVGAARSEHRTDGALRPRRDVVDVGAVTAQRPANRTMCRPWFLSEK